MEVKDLFQMQFALHYHQRIMINKKLDNEAPHCSACDSKVDITWLRKAEEAPLEHAMCLPCFLHNHTDATQAEIDSMVKLGEHHGWYKE